MIQYSLFDMLSDDSIRSSFLPKKSNDWKWSLTDYPKKNGLKVFSLFAGGGGSTMGYKLAGCDVLGCCEIDKKMNDVYIKNHHPKYNYLMDIRDFNKLENLPSEFYNLDILDGSPPCTSFSLAGKREKYWGVQKAFKEGQTSQILDDLVFIMIDTVAKLMPKVVIMENVEGILKGNAWEYVQKIYKKFHNIGYRVRHQVLMAENMGVPQKRHRVFFIATRLDFDLKKLDLGFNYLPIPYREIKDGVGTKPGEKTLYYQVFSKANNNDRCIADTFVRLGEKRRAFQFYYIRSDEIIPTVRSVPEIIDLKEMSYISKETIRNSQTFPYDFDFLSNTYTNIGYVCGMSVPPIMIKRLVERIIDSKIFI